MVESWDNVDEPPECQPNISTTPDKPGEFRGILGSET